MAGLGLDSLLTFKGLAPSTAVPFKADLFYKINPSNWYQTFPYYFDIINSGTGDVNLRFFLPIPPQNMTVQHAPASEVHATLGGAVEETSLPMFYTITLAGTTGMSLSMSSAIGRLPNQRKTFANLTGNKGIVGKVINDALGAISGVTSDIIGGGEIPLPFFRQGSAVDTPKEGPVDPNAFPIPSEGGVAKGFGEKMLSNLASAVGLIGGEDPQLLSNGFSWDHALRQFFLIYQREKAVNNKLILKFTDVKANTEYRCVPKNLQFSRVAQSPFISNYAITLKCWDIKDPNKPDNTPLDRFAAGGDLEQAFTITAANLVNGLKKVTLKALRISDIGGAYARDTIDSI